MQRSCPSSKASVPLPSLPLRIGKRHDPHEDSGWLPRHGSSNRSTAPMPDPTGAPAQVPPSNGDLKRNSGGASD